MLGGIIFQTGTSLRFTPLLLYRTTDVGRSVAITFYMLLAAEFVFRYLYDMPIGNRPNVKTAYPLDAKLKQMLGALTFSSLCIYVRCAPVPRF